MAHTPADQDLPAREVLARPRGTGGVVTSYAFRDASHRSGVAEGVCAAVTAGNECGVPELLVVGNRRAVSRQDLTLGPATGLTLPESRDFLLPASARRVCSRQAGETNMTPEPEMDSGANGHMLSVLGESGFPFQIAIADLVGNCHGWEIVATEYPWQDAKGVDHFLDFVAEAKIDEQTIVVTVECKKTSKETYTFLAPTRRIFRPENLARCVCSQPDGDARFPDMLFCRDVGLPRPAEWAAFCVVSPCANSKKPALLEDDARPLVHATDAFARWRATGGRSRLRPSKHVFLPLLVTNAPLFVATYSSADVSLGTGRLANGSQQFTPASWVKFTKAFTSSPGMDLGDRTVIVVNAGQLANLLAELSGDSYVPLNLKTDVRMPASPL